MKQRSFFDSKSQYSKSRVAHGGETKGRAKVFRPLDRRRPLHIDMKASVARGSLSMLKAKLKVDQLVRKWAERCDVTIHEFENMGNHIHMLVTFKQRAGIQKFLRTVTGLIAKLITKAERGRPFGKRFWDALAFTRIVTGRRDYKGMLKYIEKNRVERDAGPAWRQGIELYEEVQRKARRRKVSPEQIAREMLEKFEKSRHS